MKSGNGPTADCAADPGLERAATLHGSRLCAALDSAHATFCHRRSTQYFVLWQIPQDSAGLPIIAIQDVSGIFNFGSLGIFNFARSQYEKLLQRNFVIN